MNENGSNDWGVHFSTIKFVNDMLKTHKEITNLRRIKDILFLFDRPRYHDAIRLIVLDEYVFDMSDCIHAESAFGPLQIILVAGNWCTRAQSAIEYCRENNIGLFLPKELYRALFKARYWE